MKLPKRLAAVAGFVPKGSVLADIGTDHAMLPIYLIERGICRRVIATDINPGPLKAAEKAVQSRALSDFIDLRLGDGAAPLAAGEAETIVLAGMGGETISAILAAAPAVFNKTQLLILQPMTSAEDLRLWLYANEWRIEREKLALEGDRLYQIITAAPGRAPEADPLLISLGPRLLEGGDPLLPLYLERMAERSGLALAGMRGGNSDRTGEKARHLEEKLKRIEEIIRCL